MEGQDQSTQSQSSFHPSFMFKLLESLFYCLLYIQIFMLQDMDYNQALARTTQMHIQIGSKEFRITIIYDFAKVIKVDTCI